MVLTGYIDERNQLWVNITVSGINSSQKIPCLIDTGFTGELLLPLKIAIELGLRLTSITSYTLGDGSKVNSMLFETSIEWGTLQKRLVTVSVMDVDEALMGGGLLHGYTLFADFEKKALLIKEPGTDEPREPSAPNPV
jgi:clan AA aspartic protease